MATWLGPHRTIGSLFLVSDSPRRIVRHIPEVLFRGSWGRDWDADLSVAWMRSNFWRDHNMQDQFPPLNPNSLRDCHLTLLSILFEFKGKYFIRLGTVDGLTKIRSIDNVGDDFRDRIPQYKELEDAEMDSTSR